MGEDAKKHEVYADLMSQIGAGASAGGAVAQIAFTQIFCQFLDEKVHCVNSLIPSYFNKKWKSANARVDAYHLDEQTHDLTLVISDFSQSQTPESIGAVDVRSRFEQVRRFFRASCVEEFRRGIEDSEEVMPLVHLIRDNIKLITRVRYILITNKTLGKRVKEGSFDDLKKADASVESEFTVWDFHRYYEFVTAQSPIAEIEIDCRPHSMNGKGLPFLTSDAAGLIVNDNVTVREYSVYLLMVPGRSIYDWYAKYADRLLEQNVRTFLQFRGKVNQGIRKTLHGEPNRFLAYNNGLTATADTVELDQSGKYIVSIKNLQIVNGGQTTASIYTAFKDGEMVPDCISVQMKLIVTSGAHVEDFVGKISRYANSQNRIKDTDFASNQRFMLRMEDFSRRLIANVGGALRGTRWFFERTRGQYLNHINMLPTESDRNNFKRQFPKEHVFSKTDMAKYILSWDWMPWIVAKGAETAFAEFEKNRFGSDAEFLPGNEHVERWKPRDAAGNPQFNELYYKELVGKAILYRQLDKALRKSEWCKAYRAQIVTYTISLLHFIFYNNDKTFNFMPVWSTQSVPAFILDYIVTIANKVYKTFMYTVEVQNMSQWAKEDLWTKYRVGFRDEKLPGFMLNASCVIPVSLLVQSRNRETLRQEERNALEFLKLAESTEDKVWDELMAWLRDHPMKVSQAQSKALWTRVNNKRALDVQAARKLILLWQQASKEGFPYPPTGDAE